MKVNDATHGTATTGPAEGVPADGLSDAALAVMLADAAGKVLIATRDSGVFAGRDLGNAGDAVSQQFLAHALQVHRPDDQVLSEEAAADPARIDAERVWIIDPVDGTREYSEGREDWAVHVALAVGGAPGPSAVALPGIDRVMASREPLTSVPPTASPIRIAVSRSRAPEIADRVAASLGAELVPMGSAGFKAMAVLTGVADAYLHAGGQYEWDSAAPAGVALAHGLHASRIDGSRLLYNRPDPMLPDLLICKADIAAELLAAIAAEGA